MDNSIMIIAGETIEVKLGLVLGITTMASAAIGNLLSDVAGVGMGSVRLIQPRLHLIPSLLGRTYLNIKIVIIITSTSLALHH